MEKLSYVLGSLPQFLAGGFAFILNVMIPYLAGDQISWFMVWLVTISVFLAAGFRYKR